MYKYTAENKPGHWTKRIRNADKTHIKHLCTNYAKFETAKVTALIETTAKCVGHQIYLFGETLLMPEAFSKTLLPVYDVKLSQDSESQDCESQDCESQQVHKLPTLYVSLLDSDNEVAAFITAYRKDDSTAESTIKVDSLCAKPASQGTLSPSSRLVDTLFPNLESTLKGAGFHYLELESLDYAVFENPENQYDQDTKSVRVENLLNAKFRLPQWYETNLKFKPILKQQDDLARYYHLWHIKGGDSQLTLRKSLLAPQH